MHLIPECMQIQISQVLTDQDPAPLYVKEAVLCGHALAVYKKA